MTRNFGKKRKEDSLQLQVVFVKMMRHKIVAAKAEEKKSEDDSAVTAGADSGGMRLRVGAVGGQLTSAGASGSKVGQNPGLIRIQKDFTALDLSTNPNIEGPHFDDPNDLANFSFIIKPENGFWKGAKYRFKFFITSGYPHTPPKVTCETKIFHPNIDLNGAICLNILREDWKPIFTLDSILVSLVTLFDDNVNPTDPLNKEAASLLRNDK